MTTPLERESGTIVLEGMLYAFPESATMIRMECDGLPLFAARVESERDRERVRECLRRAARHHAKIVRLRLDENQALTSRQYRIAREAADARRRQKRMYDEWLVEAVRK